MSYHRALSPGVKNESITNSSNTMGSANQKVSNEQQEEGNYNYNLNNDNFKLSSYVDIKTFNESIKIPEYKTKGSSGVDLHAFLADFDKTDIKPGETALIPTGIKISMPDCLEAQIRPRSGLALKNSITVLNTPGTIDSDYRGDIGVILINHGKTTFTVNNGDRIAQMIFSPVIKVKFNKVDELNDTVRGNGGFGSTGLSN